MNEIVSSVIAFAVGGIAYIALIVYSQNKRKRRTTAEIIEEMWAKMNKQDKGGTEMMTLHDLIHKATILDNMFSCEDVPIKWCGVEIRDLLFELINGDKPEEAAINIRALIKPEEGSGTDEVTFFELNGERYVIEK